MTALEPYSSMLYVGPCHSHRVLSGFRFILEAEMTDVLAVVWCVTPQVLLTSIIINIMIP